MKDLDLEQLQKKIPKRPCVCGGEKFDLVGVAEIATGTIIGLELCIFPCAVVVCDGCKRVEFFAYKPLVRS